MSDRQLRDETITLFLAGHETTANTLSWSWWLLAQNPSVEKKFHEELDGVLGGRIPTVEDLPKLNYLNHVLTESLRLYPTAWGMARLASEAHEIAGYPVHPGYGVAFAQWVVHRDPRWYDAPLVSPVAAAPASASAIPSRSWKPAWCLPRSARNSVSGSCQAARSLRSPR